MLICVGMAAKGRAAIRATWGAAAARTDSRARWRDMEGEDGWVYEERDFDTGLPTIGWIGGHVHGRREFAPRDLRRARKPDEGKINHDKKLYHTYIMNLVLFNRSIWHSLALHSCVS